ncbi:MAG: hypothetical protein ACREEK_05820 [Bradyrhizobium sp.]
MTSTLIDAGFGPDGAEHRAGTLLSCALGATMLRMAAIPAPRIAGLLAEIEGLLKPSR